MESENKDLIVILRNGLQFFHNAPKEETQEDFERFVQSIITEFLKQEKGVLTLNDPYGIYRYDEISAVIFTKKQPLKVKPQMGFHRESA